MTRGRPLLTVVLVASFGGMVGCGEAALEETTDPASSSSSRSPAGASVEFRVVLASSLAPAPDSQVLQQFENLDCRADPVATSPEQPAVACDADGVKYALEPADIVGGIERAYAGIPEGRASWVVTLELDAAASAELADVTADLRTTGGQYALVLGGRVLTAPTVEGRITDGRVQISGNFSEESATALADRLEEG